MEFFESSFGIRPEGFYSGDVVITRGKFIVPVLYTIVLFIPHVNQAIITASVMRMNDTVNIYFTAYNGL